MAAGLPPKNMLLRDALFEPKAGRRRARFLFQGPMDVGSWHIRGSKLALDSILSSALILMAGALAGFVV